MKVIIFSLFTLSVAFAGPIVTTTSNATTLASALLGSGVTLTGTPTLTQTGSQSGTFASGPSLLGFSSGVILSSGLAASASGNYVGEDLPSTGLGGPGNAILTGLAAGQPLFDASVLTFNFIPTSSTVLLNYVFASAEYPNFIGLFSDVFGIFVNGTNYAVVPGTNTPISINSVNATTNSTYLRKYNAAGDALPYGGETTVLTLSAPVNPGVSNVFSIGVADVFDRVIDSAVFLQSGSLTSASVTAVPEPATIGLLSSSLVITVGLIAIRRRSKA